MLPSSTGYITAAFMLASRYPGLEIKILLYSLQLLLLSCWVMSDSFATPQVVAHQAPLSMGIFPGKDIGEGCHFLLQGIFPTQGPNPWFPHGQVDSLPLSQQGSPLYTVLYMFVPKSSLSSALVDRHQCVYELRIAKCYNFFFITCLLRIT